MQKVQTALMMALALVIASAVVAAEKKAQKKAPPCPAAQRVERLTAGLTLTAEQKAQFAPICKELGPKFKDAMKKGDVLTPEQKKARGEAEKAAKAAGKTAKETAEAVAAAVMLTDEQKAKQAEVRKEMAPLEKELRDKVMAVLTPEQQEQLKKAAASAKKKVAK